MEKGKRKKAEEESETQDYKGTECSLHNEKYNATVNLTYLTLFCGSLFRKRERKRDGGINSQLQCQSNDTHRIRMN